MMPTHMYHSDTAEYYHSCLKLAQKGNPHAMYQLALYHEKGQHTEKNYTSAYSWMQKAALCDIPEAQYDLAMYLTFGIGCSENLQRADFWLKKAATEGYLPAKKRLSLKKADAYH